MKNLSSVHPISASSLEPGSVVVESVSKRFRKHTVAKRSYTTVKTTIIERIFRRRFPKDNYITALDTISLELTPGSAVGIIGRNGSGKSTLLKLITGIYRPDTGRIAVCGRVSALIELGAGFHPDFTGRENVHLGGVMYGLSRKEVVARFDDIVEYAGLEDFIDDPVRTYSSGMYMRLGFSLAVHTDPDILLVDEVLSVGDAAFVHRCHETISELKRKGKTLVLVTHDLDSVERWCQEAIWLEKGVVRERGEPRPIIDSYLQSVHEEEEEVLESENLALQEDVDITEFAEDTSSDKKHVSGEASDEESIEKDLHRWGNKDVEIMNVRMLNSMNKPRWLFQCHEEVTIEVDYQINQAIDDLVFGIGILRADGVVAHGTNTDIEGIEVPIPKNRTFPVTGTYRYTMKRAGLLEGSYFLDVAAHSIDGLAFDYHHRMHKFSIRSPYRYHGVFYPEHTWKVRANYPAAEPVQIEKKTSFSW